VTRLKAHYFSRGAPLSLLARDLPESTLALCLLEGPCRSDITRRRALNISVRASHGASNQIYCVRRAEILMWAKDRPPGGWKNGASCTHTKRWSGIPSPSQKRRRVCVVFPVESRSQNNVIYLENV